MHYLKKYDRFIPLQFEVRIAPEALWCRKSAGKRVCDSVPAGSGFSKFLFVDLRFVYLGSAYLKPKSAKIGPELSAISPNGQNPPIA